MRPQRILFLDPESPRPYDAGTLEDEAMSGVAATVVRVAEGLARRHEVAVAQRARDVEEESEHGVRYLPLEPAASLARRVSPSVVVAVQGHELLAPMAEAFPHAQRMLWKHTFPERKDEGLGAAAAHVGARVVSVSDAHRRALTSFLEARAPAEARLPEVLRIYDPVEDELIPDGTPRDLDKLITTSAPGQGLAEVLQAFRFLRRRWPTMKLLLAPPAWTDARPIVEEEGVIPLEPLPMPALVRHLREALCLFTPQRAFAETFGLAYAEANAVGTPAIAHPLGAAPELLSMAKEQLIGAEDFEGIAHLLDRWRAGAGPVLTTHPAFRRSQVTSAWELAFEAGERPPPPERGDPQRPSSSSL